MAIKIGTNNFLNNIGQGYQPMFSGVGAKSTPLEEVENTKTKKTYYSSTVSKKYPGLSEQEADKIDTYVKIFPKEEQQQQSLSLYNSMLSKKKREQTAKDKEEGRKEITSKAVISEDRVKQVELQNVVNISNVAGVITQFYADKYKQDISGLQDQDIINQYITQNPQYTKLINDACNGKISSTDFGKQVGMIDKNAFDYVADIGKGLWGGTIGKFAEGVDKGRWHISTLLDTIEDQAKSEGIMSVFNNYDKVLDKANSAYVEQAFQNYLWDKYGVTNEDIQKLNRGAEEGKNMTLFDKKTIEKERQNFFHDNEVMSDYITSAQNDMANFAQGAANTFFWYDSPKFMGVLQGLGLGSEGLKSATEGTEYEDYGAIPGNLLQGFDEKIIQPLGDMSLKALSLFTNIEDFQGELTEENQAELKSLFGNFLFSKCLEETFGRYMRNKNDQSKEINLEKETNTDSAGGDGPTGNGPIGGSQLQDLMMNIIKEDGSKVIKTFKTLKEKGEPIAEGLADLFDGNSKKEDLAYKATRPSLQKSRHGKSNEQVRQELDMADKIITNYGYKVGGLRERADAFDAVSKEIWSQIMETVKDNSNLKVDAQRIHDILEKSAAKAEKSKTIQGKNSAAKIREEAMNQLERGELSFEDLEDLKEYANSKYKGDLAKDDFIDASWKELSREIGKIQEELISSAEAVTTLKPGEFSALKKAWGVLAGLKEDVRNAALRSERANDPIDANIGRIEGASKAINGLVGFFGGKGSLRDIGQGGLQFLFGEAIKKVKDPERMIKKAMDKYWEEQHGNKTPEQVRAEKGLKPLEKSEGERYQLRDSENKNSLSS